MWEQVVRRGLVPPDALVLSAYWTRGLWRRAESLEVYHLFRPAEPPAAARVHPGTSAPDASGGSAPPLPAVPAGMQPGASPAASRGRLPVAIWGPGVSVTQVLVLTNLLVSAALVFFWKDGYSAHLWGLSARLRAQLFQGWVPVLLVPLFLHAGSSHLMGNMIGLTAAGAAVEEFYGRARTLALYFFAGLSGAAFSLLRVKPVLSVGASGAIMGLYGVVLVFLLRYRKRFPERERVKTHRVYLPLLVLALLPSLFGADFYSHLGGFLGGIALALVIPPAGDRIPWARMEGGAGPGGAALGGGVS
jgi:membrane associated rhomboid family serine protease